MIVRRTITREMYLVYQHYVQYAVRDVQLTNPL